MGRVIDDLIIAIFQTLRVALTLKSDLKNAAVKVVIWFNNVDNDCFLGYFIYTFGV